MRVTHKKNFFKNMSVTSVLGHGEQLNDMELISKDINTKITLTKGLDWVKIKISVVERKDHVI